MLIKYENAMLKLNNDEDIKKISFGYTLGGKYKLEFYSSNFNNVRLEFYCNCK